MRHLFANKNQYSWYTSPLLFAFLFTLLYIIFTPDLFNPYKIDYRLMPKERSSYNYYANLNGDEFNESISFNKEYRTGRYYLEVNRNRVYVKETHSIGIMESYITDYDNDSNKELYFCTQTQDSLFLNVFDYKTKRISYSYLGKLFSTTRSSRLLKFITAYDYNNDGYKEIYLFVNGKFSDNLRCIIRCDIKNNRVKKSKRINSLIVSTDLQHNGNDINIIYSTWGLRKSPGFSSDDDSSYVAAKLSCLDDNLNDVFPKKTYEGENKAVACMNVVADGKNYIWTFIDCVNPNTKKYINKTLIEVFDDKGNKKWARFIPYDVFLLKKAFFVLYDKNKEPSIYITLRQGGLLKLNKKVELVKRINIKGLKTPMLGFKGDIDGDGSLEMFFHDNFRKKNVLVKRNFSMIVPFDRPKPYDKLETVALVGNVRFRQHNSIGHNYIKGAGENLYLESKYLSIYLNYYRDKNHWYNYLYLFLFFVFTYISVWIIRYLVTRNLQEKYKVRNRIAELQFQNVSNQMSPHFTMNAMNSIGSLIFKGDKLLAYDYLSKLAKLMKMSLLDASKSTRSIDEEINFVKAYLDLQKLRFRDKFDYVLDYKDCSVGRIQLMPFIVQTFVENAIKHGIKDLSEKGVLKILVNKGEKGVDIIIADNGIGRKAAMLNRTTPSTGKGVSLVKEYMKILNKKDDRNMSINIVDIYEEDKAAGTRVEIFIDFVS